MKRTHRVLGALLFCMLCIFLPSCSAEGTGNDEQLTILAATFPPYDFARAIAGDDASVSMLLDPGTESHSYDPTPQDIRKIQNCDIFLYGGGESDAWLDNILDSLDTEHTRILSMMELVALLDEETSEGMTTAEGSDAHDHAHEDEEYDEHVWTSPSNAAAITEAICHLMCEVDPEHAATYQSNADAYIGEIRNLATDFSNVISEASRRTLIFADRFPFLYFVREFDLDYYAAFPGCAEQTEPGAQTIAFLINKVKEEGIPVVFYTEFSSQQLADSVCEATGANKMLFHSCHNVTKSDFDAGATYVSLMRQNLENLRKALN